MLNWQPTTGSFFPLRPVKGDGHALLKVASRLGILHLPRQVLERTDGSGHVLPGNELLPEHEGMVTTRGLREWACLLPLDVGTETAQRRDTDFLCRMPMMTASPGRLFFFCTAPAKPETTVSGPWRWDSDQRFADGKAAFPRWWCFPNRNGEAGKPIALMPSAPSPSLTISGRNSTWIVPASI